MCYQEKSDGLPPRLGSSLSIRPGASTAGIKEESSLQERLEEHGKGGEELEQLQLGLEVGLEEAGKGDQACLAAHAQLGTGEH